MISLDLLILSYFNLNLLFLAAFCTWKLIAAWEGLQGIVRSATSSLNLLKLLILLSLNSSIAIYLVSGFTFGTTIELPSLGYTELLSPFALLDRISVQITMLLMSFLVIGVLFGLSKILMELLHLRLLMNRSNTLKKIGRLEVLYSEEVEIPFAAGLFWKKYIVLPARLLLSRTDLNIVLKHEIQHIRSRDLSWLLFVRLIQVFCFWNPAVKILKELLQEQQEIACDESLTGSGKVAKKLYAKCLQNVVSNVAECRYSLITPMSLNAIKESKHVTSLRRRINAIYAYIPHKRYSKTPVLVSLLPLLFVTLTLLGSTIIQIHGQTGDTVELIQQGVELREAPKFAPDPYFARLNGNK